MSIAIDHDSFTRFRDLPDQRTVVIYTGTLAPRCSQQRQILQRAVNEAIRADNPLDPELQPVLSLYVTPAQLDVGGRLYQMADRDATKRVIVHQCGALHHDKKLRLIADMGAFIAGCDRVKAATGATMLLIHHTGKNEDNGARGSSALRAALDAEFLLKREQQDDRAISLTCTKMKDAEEPARQAHDLKHRLICYDVDGDEVTSLVLIDSGRQPSERGELEEVSNLSVNHRAMFQIIRMLCLSQGGYDPVGVCKGTYGGGRHSG